MRKEKPDPTDVPAELRATPEQRRQFLTTLTQQISPRARNIALRLVGMIIDGGKK